MKQCTRCKQWKSLGEFYHDSRYRDKVQSWCKSCHCAAVQRYQKTDRGRRMLKLYRQTEGYKLTQKTSALIGGRECPEKLKARYKLKYAVRAGKLVRPAVCSCCWLTRKIEAHHPDYGEPLVVVWVCKDCHEQIQ